MCFEGSKPMWKPIIFFIRARNTGGSSLKSAYLISVVQQMDAIFKRKLKSAFFLAWQQLIENFTPNILAC